MKRLFLYAIGVAVISCNSSSDTSSATDSTTISTDGSNNMGTDTAGAYINGSSGNTTGTNMQSDTTSTKTKSNYTPNSTDSVK